MPEPVLSEHELRALRELDTCTVSNAIEAFEVRLRNTGLRELGFHLFAGNVTVSHSYAHIFHFGAPVTVGELEVRPGDLLHGDRHGVLSVPREIASQVAAVGTRLRERERRLIAACREAGMSVEKMGEIVRSLD